MKGIPETGVLYVFVGNKKIEGNGNCFHTVKKVNFLLKIFFEGALVYLYVGMVEDFIFLGEPVIAGKLFFNRIRIEINNIFFSVIFNYSNSLKNGNKKITI